MCVCTFFYRGMFNRDCHCARLLAISYRTSLAFGDCAEDNARACSPWHGRRTFFSLCYDLLSPFFFRVTRPPSSFCFYICDYCRYLECTGPVAATVVRYESLCATELRLPAVRSRIMECAGPVGVCASLNRRTQPSLWFFASHPAARGIVLVAIFIFIKVSLHILNQKG